MGKIISLFLSGGPVMWPILALSLIGVAILAWKALEFMFSKKRSPKGLVVVSTIITAEPMLGILGTVTGIIQTFNSFNSAGDGVNPLSATVGIGEALITTAAGLVAALILIFPYNVLDSIADDE
jgi:biopolymer transport protein ExbB/TolQ